MSNVIPLRPGITIPQGTIVEPPAPVSQAKRSWFAPTSPTAAAIEQMARQARRRAAHARANWDEAQS